MNIRRATIPLLLLTALLGLSAAWTPGGVAPGYDKREVRIPMRDGRRLFTAVYAPRDASRPYPILLQRTPYGVAPYGADAYPQSLGPSDELARDGFIFAYQDVRGSMMSEGDFVHMRPLGTARRGNGTDESTDAWDTIDWLVRNIPNNNGRVGVWGISYPGFYAAAAMIDAHPALRAVSPQAPIADWFVGDDFHHNGAFFLAHSFGFLAGYGYPRRAPTTELPKPYSWPVPDSYDFFLEMGPLREANRKVFKGRVPFWNELMRHGDYDDFWKARALRPHLENIRPAVMTVGGWFDAEDLFGTLAVYQAVEASSPAAHNILVMGPWDHGGWAQSDGAALGAVRFGAETAVHYRREIELPFFRHFLKGSGGLDLPEASLFLTGANEWRSHSHWPPRSGRPTSFYLREGGSLAREPDRGDAAGAFDQYTSDPRRPVPYIDRKAAGMARDYMVGDQRFAAARADVLTYATGPLEEDLTVAGPVIVSLKVSTTGTDSDFVVKLIDAYPEEGPAARAGARDGSMGGYQQLLRGEPFRGKYRNSFSRPEPFVPGRITPVEFSMPDVYHTFRRGHRVMVQVQSSWFPLVDVNPQRFVDIYGAGESDFQEAVQRIHRSRSAASSITLIRLP
ncbi:MAG: CocE/NonD family hydrolase [Acidobacteria bacterium]|jgi:putative CocE/NonD family hydrolase|nr:CocE/NonD family hydrolase [Acidobacteriota bacterium]